MQSLKHFLFIITYIQLFTVENGVSNLQYLDDISTAEMINGDIFFEIVDPSELEYTYRLRPAKDFGAPFNASFQLKNIPLVPVSPKHGCRLPENEEDVEGNVAFVERGECSFKAKAFIAEKAGARAIIVSDIENASEEYFIEMIDDQSVADVNIPAGYLMGKNGLMIVKTLERLKRRYSIINLPVNLTFTPVHKMNQPPWLGW